VLEAKTIRRKKLLGACTTFYNLYIPIRVSLCRKEYLYPNIRRIDIGYEPINFRDAARDGIVRRLWFRQSVFLLRPDKDGRYAPHVGISE
jgi:hypothetical protein